MIILFLYNHSDQIIDLSHYYVGRDANCTISSRNWTEYKQLSGMIFAHSYFFN